LASSRKLLQVLRRIIVRYGPIDVPMKIEIDTHRDALRHTIRRMAIAVGATVILTMTMIAAVFGVDPERSVRLGTVTIFGVAAGSIISALLAGILTYRSGLLMLELSKTKADLLKMSRTDQLTGLLNRRGYLEAATGVLAKAKEAKSSAVALMCDIDRFKAINDQFGHDFGDKVLIEISDTMRAFGAEHGALVARHGGEEFVALMVDVSTEQAIQRANALRQICAATKIITDLGASASVTISIGLAASAEKNSLPAMMQAADQALYLAKRGGRDRVVEAAVA
jgi:diguanylate cyclase (GGDEF)-like protein